MGYTTKFSGVLKFTAALNEEQNTFLRSMFSLDSDSCMKDGWICPHGEPAYIQLCLSPALDGIQWDYSEKFYNATEAVNFIIDNMRRIMPEFGLSGELLAQGEEVGDVWKLAIGEDGFAHHVEIPLSGQKIKCPHCHAEFILQD